MIHEEDVKREIERIRNNSSLPSPPPSPRMPDMQSIIGVRQKLEIIQRFISSFQYNYTGQPFVKMNKSRGMIHISSCAKEIIRLALPIQCIEAVFLGCLLTAGIIQLDRIPLSFKSKCHENTHRHIVLAIRYDGKWGAIGISRRSTLMNKDIRFDSLADMVDEYKRCYAECHHRLVKIYVGLPFSHDVFSDMSIKWRAIKLSTAEKDRPELVAQLLQYTSTMGKMFEYFRREGVLPPSPRRREGIPKSTRSRSTSTKRRERGRCQSTGRQNTLPLHSSTPGPGSGAGSRRSREYSSDHSDED
jgi:tubulinyl-Tyr carboxypeptidase